MCQYVCMYVCMDSVGRAQNQYGGLADNSRAFPTFRLVFMQRCKDVLTVSPDELLFLKYAQWRGANAYHDDEHEREAVSTTVETSAV